MGKVNGYGLALNVRVRVSLEAAIFTRLRVKLCYRYVVFYDVRYMTVEKERQRKLNSRNTFQHGHHLSGEIVARRLIVGRVTLFKG
jgi:hypothetical protein